MQNKAVASALLTKRGQFSQYPLYELCNHKEAMDKVLLIIKELVMVSQILPAFIEDLHHRDSSLQQNAAITLSRICQIIPETQQEILQAFMQFLHSERNPYQLTYVMKTLGDIIQSGLVLNSEILQQIISNSKSYLDNKATPYIVMVDIIDILGKICERNPETTASQIIPVLVQILNIDNVIVKKKAADALNSIGKFILPKKIFEIISYFIQSLNSPLQNLVVRKHVADTLVSICVAIPKMASQIISTFVSLLGIKTESNDLKAHIIVSLQKICEEIATKDKQKALEIALQIKPVFEQALRNESLSVKFKQQVGQVLASMYIAIPNLEPKEARPQPEKTTVEPVVGKLLQPRAREQEILLRSTSFSASSYDSSSPPSPHFFVSSSDSQKQPLLNHRNIFAQTPSDS